VDACVVTSPDGSIVTHVTVRDVFDNPINGAAVDVEYSGCPDFHPCPVACTGCVVNLPARYVRKLTNAAGQADFDLHAGGGCAAGTLRFFADGVLIAQRAVAAFDQDGDLSVTAADHALTQAKQGSGDPTADFDCSGLVDAGDLGALLARLGASCEVIVPVRPRTWGALKIVYR
jgi:hypothetical protein